ncbi:hypothetical protein MPSEU_000492900 [Mayamaea pseudoterrestris]|nr:hypothetical protein MPSEU_000492900 [Mayamaea pseudoterrestris]
MDLPVISKPKGLEEQSQPLKSRLSKRTRYLDTGCHIPIGGNSISTNERCIEHLFNSATGSFTLHLEHRVGGSCAKHVGEERILLFRSDKPGAIAKVIFSVLSVDESFNTLSILAKIHVLHVQAEYRGYDLGGLLFHEAVRSLCHRYVVEGLTDDGESIATSKLSLHCDFEVEEDLQRHNKLVNFYQSLGCDLNTNAKVQYLHDNDGVIYRRLGMRLHATSSRARLSSCLLNQKIRFAPVRLFDYNDESVSFSLAEKKRAGWVVVDNGNGTIAFLSTRGGVVRASSIDESVIISGDVISSLEKSSQFRLVKVHGDSTYINATDEKAPDGLWMILSYHDLFLCCTPSSQLLLLSKLPVFWRTDKIKPFSLTCTYESPRNQLYRMLRATQTISRVTSLRKRYLPFTTASMDIRTSLDLAKYLPALPFTTNAFADRHHPLSLRTLCFRTAECFRAIGYPDWVQLTALIYSLGHVIKLVDADTRMSEECEHDWTLPCRTRAVGCHETDIEADNDYHLRDKDYFDGCCDSPSDTYSRHCGLETDALTWTGPEYMYQLLKHNRVALPDEGLYLIRYAAIDLWHTHESYQQTLNDADARQQESVAEYANTLRHAMNQL